MCVIFMIMIYDCHMIYDILLTISLGHNIVKLNENTNIE